MTAEADFQRPINARNLADVHVPSGFDPMEALQGSEEIIDVTGNR
jgi:hypothetical protein